MRYSSNIRRRHSRQGFSLLELLIVIAVLLSVSAMAIPPMMDRLQSGRVQDAAESVREVLANARRYAIDGGVDYHFRYEINGRAYVAIPAEPSPVLANSYSGDEEDTRIIVEAGELDETLYLRSMSGDEAAAESLEVESFTDLPNAGELAQKTWSAPILFRFDGTAEDRQFRVMDEGTRTAEITVRGLTGSVRVSQVFPMEQE
jgi:prepilin-type N-terminal cleavage/methylation domain-containing protein